MPGNPWPHDMVLSIEEHDDRLLRLLFVREAWGLGLGGVPALAGVVDLGESAPPAGFDREAAEVTWREEWAVSWQRFDEFDRQVRPPDAATRALLDATPDGELSSVFSVPPSTFWNAGFDSEAFSRWRRALIYRSLERQRAPLEESPERRSLPALIAAWEGGLKQIVQLPVTGYFAERISPGCLVVSEETRFDRGLYDRALNEGAAR
ncbi:hypothetical protein [Subtercola boreus]|nr:hypothetical protein [Subtercola boreus]